MARRELFMFSSHSAHSNAIERFLIKYSKLVIFIMELEDTWTAMSEINCLAV